MPRTFELFLDTPHGFGKEGRALGLGFHTIARTDRTPPSVPCGECPYQWDVSIEKGRWRLKALIFHIFCVGHQESMAVITHLFVAVATFVYTVVRLATVDVSTSSGVLLVLSAACCFVTFAGSTFYHITVPDDQLSRIGRAVDFCCIYIGVAVSFTADLGIVTRGFSSVPIVAILDAPLAVVAVATFFIYRRWALKGEATLTETCLSVGLVQRWHSDNEHTCVRQATSFVITSFVFVLTPVLFKNIPSAYTCLSLLCVAFAVLLLGMMNDAFITWPGRWTTSSDRLRTLSRCGYLLTAHGIWHVAAIIAVVCQLCAREIAFGET